MALEKIGLGAIVTFDSNKAVSNMSKASREMGRLTSSADKVPPPLNRIGLSLTRLQSRLKAFTASMASGGRMIGTGFRNIAMGAAPLTLGLGSAIKSAVNFEKQMSAVNAVTLASAADMDLLSKEARRQGIVSVFTATQAGQAQEFLGRAGANTTQILQSLDGIINAASADEIDLATATDIVTTVVKGLGIGFEKASHVADVLALTSASAKTNITMLGESFIYGTAAARMLGLSVEETAALFGKMADAGLRGSLAGTGLTNMLSKLTKPTTKAQAIMKKWGIELEDNHGNLLKVSEIVDQFNQKMDTLKSVTEKNAILQEIFGRRGARAMSALMTAGKESIDELTKKNLEASMMFIKLNSDAEKTANALRMMGMEAEKTSYAAAVLSASTSTANQDVKSLDTTLITAISAAERFGFEVSETSVAIDELAKQGLVGAKAGSSLIAMIQRISEPTKKAQNMMEKWGIVIRDDFGKLNKMSNIVEQFVYRFSRMKSETEKAAAMQELFGERGSLAMSALMNVGKESLDKLQKELIETSSSFEVIGASAEMARRRLDNVWGASILLKSSLESLSISLLKTLMGPFKEAFQGVTDSLNSVLFLMQEMENGTVDNIRKTEGYRKAVMLLGKDGADTALSVAQGFNDAAIAIREAWDWVVNKFKEAGQWLEKTFGKDGIRKITKIATLFLFVGGLLTPVILGLGLIKIAIGGVLSIAAGLGAIFVAAFWPAIIAGGLIYFIFKDIRKENESLLETAQRVWGNIKTWVADVYNNALKPFWEGLKDSLIPITEGLGEIWRRIAQDIKYIMVDIFGVMSDGTQKANDEWRDLGQGLGYLFGGITTFISALVEGGVYLFHMLEEGFGQIWNFARSVITDVSEWFGKLGIGIEEMFSGDVVRGMKKVGIAILDFLLKPIRLIIEGVLLIAESFGAGWTIPKGLKTFAERGVTGLLFEEETKPGAPKFKGKAEKEKRALIPPTEDVENFAMGIGEGFGDEMENYPTLLDDQDIDDLTDSVKEGTEEGLRGIGESITNLSSSLKAMESKIPDVKIDNKIENKHQFEFDNKLCVDGESLNIASGRHKTEINERSGFKSTPWQRRALLEHGAAPITRTAS